MVQILIYTVLGVIAALAAYAAGAPFSRSSQDELESNPSDEEEPAFKPKKKA